MDEFSSQNCPFNIYIFVFWFYNKNKCNKKLTILNSNLYELSKGI